MPLEAVINVYDSARDEAKTFTCDAAALTKGMRYFQDLVRKAAQVQARQHAAAGAPSAAQPAHVDISVHCDTVVFEWLLGYVTGAKTAADVTVDGVVPLLVASNFLQMDALVGDCLSFMAHHLVQVVVLQARGGDLTALPTELLARLAKLAPERQLEQLVSLAGEEGHDRHWPLVHRLFKYKLEACLRDLRTTLARCSVCRQLFSLADRAKLECGGHQGAQARRPQTASVHIPDASWRLQDHLAALRAKGVPWRSIFWHVWGLVHVLYCQACMQYVPAVQLPACAYHPQQPVFGAAAAGAGGARGSVGVGMAAGQVGCYPCCGGVAARGSDLRVLGGSGCCTREHQVLPASSSHPLPPGVSPELADALVSCKHLYTRPDSLLQPPGQSALQAQGGAQGPPDGEDAWPGGGGLGGSGSGPVPPGLQAVLDSAALAAAAKQQQHQQLQQDEGHQLAGVHPGGQSAGAAVQDGAGQGLGSLPLTGDPRSDTQLLAAAVARRLAAANRGGGGGAGEGGVCGEGAGRTGPEGGAPPEGAAGGGLGSLQAHSPHATSRTSLAALQAAGAAQTSSSGAARTSSPSGAASGGGAREGVEGRPGPLHVPLGSRSGAGSRGPQGALQRSVSSREGAPAGGGRAGSSGKALLGYRSWTDSGEQQPGAGHAGAQQQQQQRVSGSHPPRSLSRGRGADAGAAVMLPPRGPAAAAADGRPTGLPGTDAGPHAPHPASFQPLPPRQQLPLALVQQASVDVEQQQLVEAYKLQVTLSPRPGVPMIHMADLPGAYAGGGTSGSTPAARASAAGTHPGGGAAQGGSGVAGAGAGAGHFGPPHFPAARPAPAAPRSLFDSATDDGASGAEVPSSLHPPPSGASSSTGHGAGGGGGRRRLRMELLYEDDSYRMDLLVKHLLACRPSHRGAPTAPPTEHPGRGSAPGAARRSTPQGPSMHAIYGPRGAAARPFSAQLLSQPRPLSAAPAGGRSLVRSTGGSGGSWKYRPASAAPMRASSGQVGLAAGVGALLPHPGDAAGPASFMRAPQHKPQREQQQRAVGGPGHERERPRSKSVSHVQRAAAVHGADGARGGGQAQGQASKRPVTPHAPARFGPPADVGPPRHDPGGSRGPHGAAPAASVAGLGASAASGPTRLPLAKAPSSKQDGSPASLGPWGGDGGEDGAELQDLLDAPWRSPLHGRNT